MTEMNVECYYKKAGRRGAGGSRIKLCILLQKQGGKFEKERKTMVSQLLLSAAWVV